jgi:hypothetical protein
MNRLLMYLLPAGLAIVGLCLAGCDDDQAPSQSNDTPLHPQCNKAGPLPSDDNTPQTVVSDWSRPVRLGAPINNACPQDAIEISADGQYLYFMFTTDVLDSMPTEEILSAENNTYRAKRIGGPGEFDEPVYYNLAKGTAGSLDGELSFVADGSRVYFHSNRPENLGYNASPAVPDFLDIYVADIVNGEPGPGRNLGSPPNSIYPDGEHAIHPDGVTLYLTSLRPGGFGGSDIYRSTLDGGSWSEPVNLGSPINTLADELQPCFTADGDTMYFTSSRNPAIGTAIYRSHRVDSAWTTPELVIRGIAGEPSLTADGQLLYFVHVVTHDGVIIDADVWYCQRQ